MHRFRCPGLGLPRRTGMQRTMPSRSRTQKQSCFPTPCLSPLRNRLSLREVFSYSGSGGWCVFGRATRISLKEKPMRSASNASLTRSLHILGPILGRKMGAKVKIGRSRACTDGNVIHLPSLPIENNEAAILGFGHLFHEANHVRAHDFSVDRRSGFVASLVGALEDIRIDGLGFQRYPGGVQDREQLIDLLVRQGSAKSAKAGDPPAAILETYLFWRLEHELLGLTAARAIAQESEALFRETFPEGVATKLDALMFTVGECHSTAHVVDLSERIARMLKNEAEPPPPLSNAEAGGEQP